ncbi:MAG: O-antigen ligase family protein [Patescibacteria group bacterium]
MPKLLKAYYKLLLIPLILALAMGLSYLPVYFSPFLVIGVLVFGVLCLIILRDPMWGMYLLIFFLPFERIGSYDISGTTIRISQIAALLTILAWMFKGLNLKSFKLRPQPLFWPIVLFLTVNCVAIINSPNPWRSFQVLLFTAFTLSICVLLPNIIRHGDQMPRLIKILYFSALIVTVFGIYQFLGDIIGLSPSLTGLRAQYTKDILGFPRIQSTALEPLYFANYLLIPLSVMTSLFLSKTSKIKPLWLIGFIIIGGINLVLTVARGGYIAFAVCLLLIGIVYFKKLFRIKNIIYGALAIVIIFISANYFIDLNLEGTKEKFIAHTQNLFDGASYVERVYTIEEAYHAWLNHPLVGIGPGSFGPYAAYHPLVEPDAGYLIVNNEYIELLAETGILGLSIFIIIALIVIIRSLRAINQAKDKFIKAILIGLLIAFVGILVQYNTFSILYIIHIWVTIGLLIACQNIVFLNKYEQ